MSHTVITAYVRSPFCFSVKGELAKVRPDELAAQTVRALINKTGINPEEIEDLLMGCAIPEAEQGFNIARIVGLLAQLPVSLPAATINRLCGSSMQAVHIAAGAIACKAGEVFICAGVESMGRVPMPGFNPLPHPGLYETLPAAYMSMGETAENLAKKYAISRQEQDEFALLSHQKAAAAQQAGHLDEEIIAINTANGQVSKDGCIRPDTSLEALAGLKPAFDAQGSITAGTSAPLTDGATALLVCSEDYAVQHDLPALARIKSFAVSACAPEIMGIGPVEASRKALQRAGLDFKDMGVIEMNEAFAAQSLACLKEMPLDTAKLNIDGGALAIGHPLGATGARLIGKTAALLQREGQRYGLATQCIGGGQGIATVLERCG